MKNIKKLRSFNNFKASKPKMSPKDKASPPVFEGGVLGNVKLKSPKINEATDTIKKVLANAPAAISSGASQLR